MDIGYEISGGGERRPVVKTKPLDPASFLFFGAGSPWVYALAEALATGGCSTTVIHLIDSHNFRRLRPTWPANPPPQLQLHRWVLPRGYAGILSPLFTYVLGARLRELLIRRANKGGEHPWIIVPYPWFSSSTRGVPAQRLVYYNYDDYPLFRPKRAETILRQERSLIARAALTLCASQRQTEILRTRCPEKSGVIRHFPHGVVEWFLNSRPDETPAERTVGYVGNLIDRVDWRLVQEVADQLPDVEFVFVGSLEGSGGGGARPDWEAERAAALSRPNVRRLGPVPQDEVCTYYWGFGVNWIPYATDHSFNAASCPTKIMDGIASGRPMLSTAVPECCLYPDWITIAHSAPDAGREISRLLISEKSVEAGERARKQVQFARQHTWSARADTLREWLSGTLSSSSSRSQ